MDSYPRTTIDVIFGKYMTESVAISADGVRVSEDYLRFDTSGELLWHPASEFEGEAGAPDPLEVPNLPIPFTARELAAFMIDGVGAMLPSVYGAWNVGPDEGMLRALGPNAAKPREALRSAYSAYREAEIAVGPLNLELQKRAASLLEKHERENGRANEREGVFAPGLTNRERNARRARARVSVAQLHADARSAEGLAAAEFARWRKAIVRHLLAAADDGSSTSVSRGATEDLAATTDGPSGASGARRPSVLQDRDNALQEVLQNLDASVRDAEAEWKNGSGPSPLKAAARAKLSSWTDSQFKVTWERRIK